MQQPTAHAGSGRSTEAREFWVVSQTATGYRVYQAGNPTKLYSVTGSADAPSCNCGAIQLPNQRLSDRCVHIQAVFGTEDPAEIPEDDEPPHALTDNDMGDPEDPEDNYTPTNLVLKRSVSPDGRIDSFSVELTCPVDGLSPEDIEEQALTGLMLQTVIVDGFLERQNTPRPKDNGNGGNGNGGNAHEVPLGVPIPARLTTIDGMQTRMGWSYYVNVEVNGQVVRLFGNRRKMQEYIGDAGHDDSPQARNIVKGAVLNLPCKVVLGRRDNDKYLTVLEVRPSTEPRERYHPGRRGGR